MKSPARTAGKEFRYGQQYTFLSSLVDFCEVQCIHFRLQRHHHSRHVSKLPTSKELLILIALKLNLTERTSDCSSGKMDPNIWWSWGCRIRDMELFLHGGLCEKYRQESMRNWPQNPHTNWTAAKELFKKLESRSSHKSPSEKISWDQGYNIMLKNHSRSHTHMLLLLAPEYLCISSSTCMPNGKLARTCLYARISTQFCKDSSSHSLE